MKKLIYLVVGVALLSIFTPTVLGALTAEEIIKRRDANEHFETAQVEAEMIIINRNRRLVKTMTSYAQGDNGLVVFTNPGDRGTKFLKRGDELWMFFPEAEDLVKISGHMLNQGIMGSDFSYQDVMESDKLTDLYNFELIGEEVVDGRPCYVLEGTAVEGKEVSYYRRKSWVDKERFVGLKEELYARSGRLLKVMTVTKVAEIAGRWYPVESVMEDKLRRDTRTEFIIKAIEFNPQIPAGTFTLENLR
ncbi:MAG TPA: outer membrane lipoprotein-sorting protein [Firmicutes bacterium]|uniref:Outer membrane lipoprotein-sorting protein n=1 Tax=Capillibacterium thermochitinicola TaxID=2699427 RepID=A0A8J6HRU2_9FIRM|nr:outer membrane lipoprotein-sorting protein [Capillibacterium thermochitinicola]MBA2132936.1 outer membrane lipoprotein-sorting protein [Capillibacterium thermochitinicola]HHW13140.1 outer membrane lipoprotein-sorting protein [Bacillota bacterium]